MEIDNANQQVPPVQNTEQPQSAPLPNPLHLSIHKLIPRSPERSRTGEVGQIYR